MDEFLSSQSNVLVKPALQSGPRIPDHKAISKLLLVHVRPSNNHCQGKYSPTSTSMTSTSALNYISHCLDIQITVIQEQKQNTIIEHTTNITKMALKEAVLAPSDKAPPPLPFYSQAIKSNGMVYCSGQIATDPKTGKMVEGSITDRTVGAPWPRIFPNFWTNMLTFLFMLLTVKPFPALKFVSDSTQEQVLKNLSEVLIAAGSHIDKVVKVNIFITNMENFAAVNQVYTKWFSKDPKPARSCVAVFQLPLQTDVEIECVAHL